jgi:hypothetical protein
VGVGLVAAIQLFCGVFGSCLSNRANVLVDAKILTENTTKQTTKKKVFFYKINIHVKPP